ncbi:PilZ domain-containing protein [Qipengyuania marisflavi]|uniref:PilZ domain-containing protein n=1 Tax=Qipengyuania marisflavi TaxID=2486356 RepID=A0A5S3P2Q1_9SPHN|nr:PilZ domain-containing protein [Qipengyuania marisflavi]TMM47141.1 hypothetical protein FEV51_10140 [Qipengyuania marisflavi]
MIAREPRKNVMISATIEGDGVSAPVRIRNLSDRGAMIDGAALPETGSQIMLRRLQWMVGATVIWAREGRCGLQLENDVVVDEWITGTRSATQRTNLGQLRVDKIQAALRDGGAVPAALARPAPPPPAPTKPVDLVVAQELARLKEVLDAIALELSEDMDVLMRHGEALQNLDIASATVESLEQVLSAEDVIKAIAEVPMKDLRDRLSGIEPES